MARWTLKSREVTFDDALHAKNGRAIVCVESGPMVDDLTKRTYFHAIAGQSPAIVDTYDRIDPGAYNKWAALIRLGDANISGRIYLFASTRTELLETLKQYVDIVEHGLLHTEF